MSTFRALFAQRDAKTALLVWALVPTIFLFFALTLAVDPTAHLDKVRLGVAVLDAGVTTPKGQLVIGSQLVSGLQKQLPLELIQFKTEAEMRDAVLAHDLSGGIIFPQDMTANLQGGKPIELRVVKSDANDPFTNGFMTNLPNELASNLNSSIPLMLAGGGGAAQPPTPLVTVATDKVATSTDFRFATVPASLLLPVWMATVAFAVLLSRAGTRLRDESGRGVIETGLTELATGLFGSGITAAVITLDIALFTWRGDLNLLGLFAFLWLGLLACAWLIQGAIWLLGVELGALISVIALFIQQPVSGAAFPASFAPDSVSWAEGIAPLRYLVEGVRNLLIGGSTTGETATALGLLALAGLVLFAGGVARLMFMPSKRRSAQSASAS